MTDFSGGINLYHNDRMYRQREREKADCVIALIPKVFLKKKNVQMKMKK